MASSQIKFCYEFGPFRLDASERLLLLVLLDRHGHLPEKGELLRRDGDVIDFGR
jgi:hypothetical protein